MSAAVRSVHDRAELAALLRRDAALHAYELGDLDDDFWPYTTWYRVDDAVALLYHGAGQPTLLALDRPERLPAVTTLLSSLAPLLPAAFHGQVSAGAQHVLAGRYHLAGCAEHLKMTLTEPDRLAGVVPRGEPLGPSDLGDLTALYDLAYPDHWFRPQMLANGPYLGVRRDGVLVAAAGTHVWSSAYRVAALGNVTTHPDARGQGLATALVARWCRQVAGSVDHVALNVKADNPAAVRVYERLGFTTAGRFADFQATARAS